MATSRFPRSHIFPKRRNGITQPPGCEQEDLPQAQHSLLGLPRMLSEHGDLVVPPVSSRRYSAGGGGHTQGLFWRHQGLTGRSCRRGRRGSTRQSSEDLTDQTVFKKLRHLALTLRLQAPSSWAGLGGACSRQQSEQPWQLQEITTNAHCSYCP